MAKRNARGGGSIRQRPDGTWEARYMIGYDPGTGKPIRKSIYAKTQKEVRQKLSAAVNALDEGTYFEPSKITLASWIDTWLADYCDDKKYLTLKHYTAQCKTHIKPKLGAVKLSALTAPMIQKFYNELLHGSDEVAPLSPKSVRNIHGILTKVLNTAVRIGYLKSNPSAMATLPRKERKEIHPLTDEQVKAFLRIAETDDYNRLFQTILFTGLRESEAIGLTWDCVDFENGKLLINKQLQKRPLSDGGFTFAPLKNDKSRVIAPASFVMDALRARRLEQAYEKLACGDLWIGWQNEKERKTALVFTNKIGSNLSPQTVYNHYKKLAAQIEAPNTCVHDLRHTYAVLSLQNGDDVKTVQSNLGHATAAFTLDVYGHVSEKMKVNSADRMQHYIQNL